MAGKFTFTFYTASYGDGSNVHPIRVQPETLLAQIGGESNAADATTTNNPISAMVGASKRQKGLHARKIALEWTSTPPTGYDPDGIIVIPCLTETFYNAATTGAVGVYLGNDVRVVYQVPEQAK